MTAKIWRTGGLHRRHGMDWDVDDIDADEDNGRAWGPYTPDDEHCRDTKPQEWAHHHNL